MKIIMKKYSYYSSLAILFLFTLYTIASIHRYLVRFVENQESSSSQVEPVRTNQHYFSTSKSEEFVERIDFDKIDENSNYNVVYERCLEEISKLKAKIQNLETKLNRCEFKLSNHHPKNKTNEIRSEEMIKRVVSENEADLFTYSAFTYEKLFAPNSDIYHRNVVRLSGARKVEIQKVVEKSLEYLNVKPNHRKNNFSIGDFQLGFTRSTPQSGYEYELYFRNHFGQCCTQLKIRRALNPDLELVEYSADSMEEDAATAAAAKKLVNFVLPLSGGERSERTFRLFLSSFESVVVVDEEDSSSGHHSPAALTVAFQGTHVDFGRFKELVNEFKRRTKFEAIRFVRVLGQRFSRAKSIQTAIENLNCDPNDCLIFICDVDVLFNRNFLDFCRSNAIQGERVFFPILYSFYNPSLLSSKHFSLVGGENETIENNDSATAADDSNKRLNLIINKESGFWRESGFGMACLHREDFRSVNGFEGLRDDETGSWGGEDLFLLRKFARSPTIQVFRSITPGLFHMYHAKECDRDLLTPRQYTDCLTAKVFNEASHRDFGLLYFNNNKTQDQE